MPKCVDIEKVSEDAQGRTVKIGDTVFSMAKNYRSLVEAKVIDITPKTLLVEYINYWNYSRGVVERYRVGSDQIMLKAQDEVATEVYGLWEDALDDVKWGNSLIKKHCSACKQRPHFDKEKREFILSKYCPNCGAPMDLRSR